MTNSATPAPSACPACGCTVYSDKVVYPKITTLRIFQCGAVWTFISNWWHGDSFCHVKNILAEKAENISLRATVAALTATLDNEGMALTYYILRTWNREKLERFCLHLLGDKWQTMEGELAAQSQRVAELEARQMYAVSVTVIDKDTVIPTACAWCNKEIGNYPIDVEIVRAHNAECPTHPMRQLETQISSLTAQIAQLTAEHSAACNKAVEAIDLNIRLQGQLEQARAQVAALQAQLEREPEKLVNRDGWICQPLPGEIAYKVWMPKAAHQQWLDLEVKASQSNTQTIALRTLRDAVQRLKVEWDRWYTGGEVEEIDMAIRELFDALTTPSDAELRAREMETK